MKILALTFGDSVMASTHYRLFQFRERLSASGVELTLAPASGFSDWSSLQTYDLVIVQKKLMRGAAVKRIRANARRLVYDTDDAVWEPHGKQHFWWTRIRTRLRVRGIAGAADVCTVANEHLGNAMRDWAQAIEVIPMALDEMVWTPATERPSGPVRIGWAGAPPNLVYLTGIEQVLAEVQKLRSVEIVVYCGEAPRWSVPIATRHVQFQPGTEPNVVQQFDIGLLPLPDNPFAAGKSPIKALQYAACGIPCVASPVGATVEIVRDGETGRWARSPEEWKNALCQLVDDVEERARLGQNARQLVVAKHGQAAVVTRMIEVWRDVVQSSRD